MFNQQQRGRSTRQSQLVCHGVRRVTLISSSVTAIHSQREPS